jgi:hypothetical protein
MNLFLGESLPTLGALGVFALFLLSSGALSARLLRFPGFAESAGVERLGIALLCAVGVMPILLELAGRIAPQAIPIVAGAACLAGLPTLAKGGDPLPKNDRWFWLAAGATWIAISIALVIDWPDGSGGLTHSLLILDYVKHNETTWAIAQTGTPPINPTFYSEDHRVSYYYFFYTMTAAVSVVSAFLFGAEPRHAAYAAAPLAGFIVFALTHLLWSRARCDEAAGVKAPGSRAGFLLLALLLASGPDILFVLRNYFVTGEWPLFAEAWSQLVTWWFDSALWVPHHLCGVVAAYIGLLALARPSQRDWRQAVFAGLSFASMAGLSIYVAMGGVLLAAFWLIALLQARRFGDALRLICAGALSALLAAPWILTILGRVSDGKAPLAFAIRNGVMIEDSTGSPALDIVLKLALMIAIYAGNFGVFALGAHAFWKTAGRKGLETDVGLLLALGAAMSFLIGSFVESAILLNDLGWRIMLFAEMPALIWTLSALRAGALNLRSPGIVGLLALGYASIVYSAVQLRLAPLELLPSVVERHRRLDVDEKSAWAWVNANTPRDAVVLAQPNLLRAYDYGVYAQRRAAVSDTHVGQLFGVPERLVEARVAELKPIFFDPALAASDVEALAARYRVKAIVVNALDPVFDAPGAWTSTRAPAFASPRARVYLVGGADK